MSILSSIQLTLGNSLYSTPFPSSQYHFRELSVGSWPFLTANSCVSSASSLLRGRLFIDERRTEELQRGPSGIRGPFGTLPFRFGRPQLRGSEALGGESLDTVLGLHVSLDDSNSWRECFDGSTPEYVLSCSCLIFFRGGLAEDTKCELQEESAKYSS